MSEDTPRIRIEYHMVNGRNHTIVSDDTPENRTLLDEMKNQTSGTVVLLDTPLKGNYQVLRVAHIVSMEVAFVEYVNAGRKHREQQDAREMQLRQEYAASHQKPSWFSRVFRCSPTLPFS